jgi:hypothetical protein
VPESHWNFSLRSPEMPMALGCECATWSVCLQWRLGLCADALWASAPQRTGRPALGQAKHSAPTARHGATSQSHLRTDARATGQTTIEACLCRPLSCANNQGKPRHKAEARNGPALFRHFQCQQRRRLSHQLSHNCSGSFHQGTSQDLYIKSVRLAAGPTY